MHKHVTKLTLVIFRYICNLVNAKFSYCYDMLLSFVNLLKYHTLYLYLNHHYWKNNSPRIKDFSLFASKSLYCLSPHNLLYNCHSVYMPS